MLVEVGVQVVNDSCEDHLIYMSSCVEAVPIVVSDPKEIKCLSGVETNVNCDAVGQPLTTVALVEVALSAFEFHSKVEPSEIVAISLFPKLSSDQSPGAVTMSPVCDAPHLV